jgi:D-alanyl-D-alanine carboxypeptidase
VARQPSTLNSQANALMALSTPAQAGETQRSAVPPLDPPPSRLKGPMPPPQFAAAPVGVGYEIQIGAYGSVQEAEAKLDVVRNAAVGLLNGHGGVTLPVQRDERQIFRARFVHFDENGASNACLELRRLAIDCFVMKAD